MSETKNKGSKLGSNPLGGGALDWLEEEPAPGPLPSRRTQRTEKAKTGRKTSGPKARVVPEPKASDRKGKGNGKEDVEIVDRSDSTRRGVAVGYRRHTLLMREDQIEQLDRLYALEKLHAGPRARSKKDLVEEAFDLFFQSAGSKPGGVR